METNFALSSSISPFDADHSAQGRQTFFIFAVSLFLGVTLVLLLIAGSTPAEALPVSNAVQAKADGGVALAAMGSLTVSAVIGTVLFQTLFRRRARCRVKTCRR